MRHRDRGTYAVVERQRRSVPRSLRHSRPISTPAIASADPGLESMELTRCIRVIVVSTRFLLGLGGTETHVYEVTRRMAKDGDIDLTVATADPYATVPVRELVEGSAL